MKYGFKGKEDFELIKGYIPYVDDIEITILDDTIFSIPYTEENIKRIDQKMIEQAKLRNTSFLLNDVTKGKIKAIVSLIIEAGFFSANVLIVKYGQFPSFIITLCRMTSVFTFFLIIHSLCKINNYQNIMEELKKI